MPLSDVYEEVLSYLSGEELEDEYGAMHAAAKEQRRRKRYGLYWWYMAHATAICDEIRRRNAPVPEGDVQLSLAIPGRVAPEERPRA